MNDYGAWLSLGSSFTKPIQLPSKGSLILDFGVGQGGPVNLTLYFKLKGGKLLRSPPLLLREHKPLSYRLAIRELIEENDVPITTSDVEEVHIKLNDVANFEEIGVPVEILIKNIRLEIVEK